MDESYSSLKRYSGMTFWSMQRGLWMNWYSAREPVLMIALEGIQRDEHYIKNFVHW